MLNHIIGIEEAAHQWALNPSYVKQLCEERKIVSKKIGETWIIYRDQRHPSQLTEEDVKKLDQQIEWELMTREERLFILDENTRRFYRNVESVKRMYDSGIPEQRIREIWSHLNDDEFSEILQAMEEVD